MEGMYMRLQGTLDPGLLVKAYLKGNYSNCSITELNQHLSAILYKALQGKEAGKVKMALSFGFTFKLFRHNDEHIEMLYELLLQDWHKEHKDIAFILTRHRCPQGIDMLYLVACKNFRHIGFDTNFQLSHNCIEALYDINTPPAIEKLQLLSRSNNSLISAHAKGRLKEMD
jgi:hypothetical protein